MKSLALGSAVVMVVASLAAPGPRPVQAQAVELVILDVAAVAKRALYGIRQVGGFLGIGGHLVAVPFGDIRIAEDGKVMLPGASREQLRRLPQFIHRAS